MESNQPTGQQLTPEFYAEKNWVQFKGEYYITIQDFISCMEEYAAQQTAALREELEKEKQSGKILNWSYESAMKELEELKRCREAVKKERDALKIQRVKDADDFLTLLQQRDEAVKLLRKCKPFIDDVLTGEFNNRTGRELSNDISRLSSGETKPASPWISVEDRLPVVGDRYNFINDITHSPYYGEVFGGKYMGCRYGHHEFSLPGHSMTAKYYCPIPAPPESLTDKK